MSIVKNYKRKNRYSTIDSTGVLDESLSWKAKGLLWYILSKPDDWQIRMADLVKRSKDGRDATRRALTELEENRYAVRTRSHDEKGLFCWNTIVFDCAEAYEEWAETEEGQAALSSGKASRSNSTDQKPIDGLSIDGLSIDGFSVDGLSVDGKPEVIYINDLTNIESTIIEKEKKKEILEPLSFFPSGKNEESEAQNNISSHAQTHNPNIQDPQTPKPLSPVAPENFSKPIHRNDRPLGEYEYRKDWTQPLIDDGDFVRYLFIELKKVKVYFQQFTDRDYESPVKEFIRLAWQLDPKGDGRFEAIKDYKRGYDRYKAAKKQAEEERLQREREAQASEEPSLTQEELNMIAARLRRFKRANEAKVLV